MTRAAAVSHSRTPRAAEAPWVAVAAVFAGLALLPILALAVTAAQDTGELWVHIVTYVLPPAVQNTVLLLVGTGIIVTLVGTGAAWLVTAYSFPGRGVLEWALLLPLAIPTYIMAYAYMDVLGPLGPLQSGLRDLLGIASPRDFRLPDLRAMWGAVLLFGFVLYPYVYLTTRAMFLTQAANLLEVSRTLGVGRGAVLWRVALPLARPAIAVGVALALMEALNDVGAAQFLGVSTLTVSVYTTWIVRNDLAGAAQIAMAMLVFVVAMVMIERWARRNQRFAASAQRARPMVPRRLTGLGGLMALALGSLPIVVGFVGPALYLSVEAIRRIQFAGVSPHILEAALNTVTLSAVATLVVLVMGFSVAYAARLRPGRLTGVLARVATLGYAVPGTVLAIGILLPVAAFDRFLDHTMRDWFGISTGLLLLGSGAALVYAYAARYLAIASGGIEAGLSRIPLSYDQAARTLGQSALGTLGRVHLPLSRAALTAAGLLVFVDCAKELPATLMLRPLDFESLSTLLYGEAVRGTYEEGSVAALLIVLVGILPVILLARTGRPGGAAGEWGGGRL